MLLTALPVAGQGFFGKKLHRYAWIEQLFLHIVFGLSFWWALGIVRRIFPGVLVRVEFTL